MFKKPIVTVHILLALSACTATQDPYRLSTPNAVAPKSQRLNEHRTTLIINGGQKIPIPREETEVGILWSNPQNLPPSPYYTAVLRKNDLANSIVGEVGELEALIAKQYLEQILDKNGLLTKKVIDRAKKYLPYIINELQKRGLPIELVALPMIESAYVSNAISHVGAAGLWQIMPLTAKELGLQVSTNNDERFHFQRSTHAALNYLEMLYSKYGNWTVALTAYNCGPARLENALKRSQTSTLLDLFAYCEKSPSNKCPLPTESRRYVPRFISAFVALRELGILPQPQQPISIAEAKKHTVKTAPPKEQPLKLRGHYIRQERLSYDNFELKNTVYHTPLKKMEQIQ